MIDSDSEEDKNFDAANYCAVIVIILGNNSQASITGHTQTTFIWNQVYVIMYTIYSLVPRYSAEDYTASSYFNLMLVITTSLS